MIFRLHHCDLMRRATWQKKLRAEWPNIAKEAELPKQVLRALHEHLDRIPLLRG
jgi:hypothetical protein